MKEERIWLLVARKLAGEATEKEVKELENLLNENTELSHILKPFPSGGRSMKGKKKKKTKRH